MDVAAWARRIADGRAPIMVCCLTFADRCVDEPARPASGEGDGHATRRGLRRQVVRRAGAVAASGYLPGLQMWPQPGSFPMHPHCRVCERTVMSDRSLRCVVACWHSFSSEEMPSLAAVTTQIRGGRPSRGRSPSAGLLSVAQHDRGCGQWACMRAWWKPEADQPGAAAAQVAAETSSPATAGTPVVGPPRRRWPG